MVAVRRGDLLSESATEWQSVQGGETSLVVAVSHRVAVSAVRGKDLGMVAVSHRVAEDLLNGRSQPLSGSQYLEKTS